MSPTVAVVDYGAGNLYSVRRALEKAGACVELTSDPARLRAADGIVLPGVGSARAAMERLDSLGVSDVLREHVRRDRPLLGVCLGMQLFFGANEEGPSYGLDLLPGKVVRMRGERKVPHMGWNNLERRSVAPLHTGGLGGDDSPLMCAVADGSYAYFLHSYQVLPERADDVLATCDYEGEVVAVAGRGNLVGTQFHPEKSGDVGLKMYANFVGMVGR